MNMKDLGPSTKLGVEAVLEAAKKAGIHVELQLYQAENIEVTARKGKIDEIQRKGPSQAGLRLFKGARSISASTTKVSPDGLMGLYNRLLGSVKLVDEDPASGLAKDNLYVNGALELDLYDSAVEAFGLDKLKDLALRAEAASLAKDPRVKNSEGFAYGAVGTTRLFSTQGLTASDIRTKIGVYASPVAEDKAGNKKEGSWGLSTRFLSDLGSPEKIGEEAGHRAVRLLGAEPIKTGKYPIVFDRLPASALLKHFYEAISGSAVWKKSTFLSDDLGKQVAAKIVSLVDDPHMPRMLGSAAFDDEGVATKPLNLVKNGMLQVYPCDTYSAARLGTISTGNCSRGMAGPPSVAPHNLYISSGSSSLKDLMGLAGEGFLVTGFIGFGFNLATGDFSRGAQGFWFKDGVIVSPVHEVTVSGNLGTMFKEIAAVGADLVMDRTISSPSLLINGMTTSGK
jgi:PmbA protein